MNFSLEETTVPASREGEEERRDLVGSIAEHKTGDRLEAIERLLDEELEAVLADGKALAGLFWQAHMKAREDDNNALAVYGTRVRLVRRSFSAEWFRNRYVQQRQGKAKVYSTYLKKSYTYRYSMNVFKGAADWERQVIEHVEQGYEVLRRRAATLKDIERNIAIYRKLRDG